MKLKFLNILMIIAVTAGLAACDGDINPNPAKPTGQVRLRTMAIEVNNAEKVVSRAADAVDVSGFLVDINSTDGKTQMQYKYADLPEVLTLPVGDYSVQVRSHLVQSAEWDRPYFTGTATFSITADGITELQPVVCTFASLKVTIKYTDRLKQLMGSDCKVTVMAGTDGRLDYTADEQRAGYFAVVPGSNTLVAVFNGTVGGAMTTASKSYNAVEAGQHLILTFDAKTGNPAVPDEYGTVSPNGITVDISVVEVDLRGNIDSAEDIITGQRPGTDPDEPVTPPQPSVDAIKFSSSDVKFNEDTDYTQPNGIDGSSYVVHITSTEGIAHLNVTINSSDQNFLDAVSDLLPLSFDLANPGEYDEAFQSLGFPTGSQVAGAKAIDFKITDFIPLLSAFPGTHSFKLNVVDAKGNSATRTLTFLAK